MVLAHATRVKAIATAKVKTDKVDSDTLALLLRADLILLAHMIAPAQVTPSLPPIERFAQCPSGGPPTAPTRS